jgi:hypothetical protein
MRAIVKVVVYDDTKSGLRRMISFGGPISNTVASEKLLTDKELAHVLYQIEQAVNTHCPMLRMHLTMTED